MAGPSHEAATHSLAPPPRPPRGQALRPSPLLDHREQAVRRHSSSSTVSRRSSRPRMTSSSALDMPWCHNTRSGQHQLVVRIRRNTVPLVRGSSGGGSRGGGGGRTDASYVRARAHAAHPKRLHAHTPPHTHTRKHNLAHTHTHNLASTRTHTHAHIYTRAHTTSHTHTHAISRTHAHTQQRLTA